MDMNRVTLQDCIDMYRYRGKATIVGNGRVIGFLKEAPARITRPRKKVEWRLI